MRNDFAVFILSHGRADRVITVATLRRCGYTGKIYIICDSEDDQLPEYKKRYGDAVIVFDKSTVTVDTMDNEGNDHIVLYARNTCHKIAKDLGLHYFLELDDDYSTFCFRFKSRKNKKKLLSKHIENFDEIVDLMIEWLETSGALSVAFAQGGDFLGGSQSKFFKDEVKRKAMNSFFCSVDRPFKFIGRINEDVNAYITLGSRGALFFTIAGIMLTQQATQANENGLTDVYLEVGTYRKSFYSVMCMPSAVKISVMGQNYQRIHHKVYWEHCVPKIISGRFKK